MCLNYNIKWTDIILFMYFKYYIIWAVIGINIGVVIEYVHKENEARKKRKSMIVL